MNVSCNFKMTLSKSLNKIFLVTFFFQSCYYASTFDRPIQRRIIAKADSCFSVSDNCVIDLNALTSFKWDKLYEFDEYSSADEISKVLGFNYSKINHVPDETTLLIFTFKDSVVYQETYSWSLSKYQRIEYIDMPIDSTSFSLQKQTYTKLFPYIKNGDATFLIKKFTDSSNPKTYSYGLIPIKDTGKTYTLE
jgi:hypothetical protein